MQSTTGFIGLGRMGGGMALNLIKAGHRLKVYDESNQAMQGLVDAGAVAATSAADVAVDCPLVFLCLPYSPQVRAAVFGPNGIASAGQDELTVIDNTTLDRSDALDIAAQAKQHGIQYWDCPVSGMPFRADDGTLTVMFGGTKSAFQSTRPYLECFGEFIVHCGALGSGQAMKAINNVIYDINIVALCEMLPLAVAMGLDSDAVAKVVTTASARSFASEYFVPRMMDRKFDTDFAMGDAFKDIVNVQKMALETNAMLPVTNAMIASYQAAMLAGFENEPKSAILKVYENALKVQFEKSV